MIKHRDIAIDGENPFSNDKLERLKVAENLTKLISTFNDSFVLAINSPWGTGKTTFIKMWECYLRNEGYSSLYFNAWENDYSDEPLLSLIGEIQEHIDSGTLKSENPSQLTNYINKAKKLSGNFLRRATPLAIKIMTHGLVNIEESEGDIADFMSSLAEDGINEYINKKNSMKEFKANLENLVRNLTEESGSKKLIIIIIDELDRCRPLYAIELLESIKHLFSVSGIVFVLAIDMEQLSHSIKTLYGTGMNAEGYLKRFIDLEFSLPNPPINLFCDFLLDSLQISNLFKERENPEEIKYLRNTLVRLFELYNVDLRTQIHILTRINIVIRIVEPDKPLFPECLAFLVTIKICRSSFYNKIKNDSFPNRQDIYDGITREGKPLNTIFNDLIGQILFTCIETRYVEEKNIEQQLQNKIEAFRTMNLTGDDSKQAINFLDQLSSKYILKSHKMNVLDYLIPVVEVSEDFKI